MLISIIIPVYNKEKYLDECIKSVVNQDYKDIEIIIINDGSQDNSENIIKQWISKDSRIRYLTQENKGVASARNKGISMANGKYLFFLDADDLLKENAILTLVNCAEQTEADIITANFFEKIEDKIIKKPSFSNQLYSESDLYTTDVILEMFIINNRHMAMAGNKLYKTEFLKKHKITYFDGVIAEDRLFNLMCYVNKPVIQVVNKYTYVYNILENSRSRTFSSKYYDESIALLNYFYDYLLEESKVERHNELFQLIILYDVYKIINQTYEHASRKIIQTKIAINRLRREPLVFETIRNMIMQRKYRRIKAGKTFFRMRLINFFLIKAPFLIIFYKMVGYLTRGIRYSLHSED